MHNNHTSTALNYRHVCKQLSHSGSSSSMTSSRNCTSASEVETDSVPSTSGSWAETEESIRSTSCGEAHSGCVRFTSGGSVNTELLEQLSESDDDVFVEADSFIHIVWKGVKVYEEPRLQHKLTRNARSDSCFSKFLCITHH